MLECHNLSSCKPRREGKTRDEKDNFLAALGREESSRRDFMKTAGKLAVYTSPLIIALMQPSRAALAGSAGCGGKWTKWEHSLGKGKSRASIKSHGRKVGF